jgi:hypothetical protein
MLETMLRFRRKPDSFGRTARTTAVTLAFACATLLSARTALAGPFGLPGLPSPVDFAKDAAYNAALASFGRSLAGDVPIASSANDVYATVANLPGAAFAPKLRIAGLAAKLRASGDGTIALPRGDYQIAVDVFCMHLAAHSPAGHRYQLAPLRGSMADVIAALDAAATGSSVKHSLAQLLSWDVQNGVTYAQMAPNVRVAADTLLAKFRGRLQGDPLAQARAQYASATNAIPHAPSFDDALRKLGDVGATMLSLEAAHDSLVSLGGDADAAMRRVSTGPNSGAPGGAATPWSRVSARVFERLITNGTYATPATLQIRVLPPSVAVASLDVRALGAAPDAGAPVPVTNVVGDPGDGGVQPLTASPQTPDGGPSGSNPATPSGVSPPPPAHSSHWHTVDNPHQFPNCAAAAQYINDNPDGVANAAAGLTPHTTPIAVALGPDGNYHATTNVTWSLDPSATTITMPNWSWPNMSAADASALSSYYSELLGHEEGHVTIAQQYAADQGTHPLEGVGATPAAAQANLASNGAAYKQHVADGLNNLTDSYDSVTNHGATQVDGPNASFPGGPNVALNCP